MKYKKNTDIFASKQIIRTKNQFIKISHMLVLVSSLLLPSVHAQDVTIIVDATMNKKTVSPYIYGRNESFDKPAEFYKDAGLRFARMNAGNNATKYNWRKKITSHPDWYNNVYSNDWDATSKKVATNQPDMQVMWAFQSSFEQGL